MGGVSGQRRESKSMSKPLGVSSCRLTYLDLLGCCGSKELCANSSFGTNLERAVKLLVTYKNRKRWPHQGWGQNGLFTQLQGLGLLLTVLFSIPPPSEEIRMDEYLQTVQ